MSSRPTNRSAGRGARANSDGPASARRKVSFAVDEAQTLAQDQYDKLIVSIRRKPLQAAAIAAGIGFVLAILARR
jgi:ElaB/YqjD/DUF883 family membrane-anchored ribosome-binding protein